MYIKTRFVKRLAAVLLSAVILLGGLLPYVSVRTLAEPYYYNGTEVPGVHMSGDPTNFTATMPIATIYIDETIVNQKQASRDAAKAELLTTNTDVFSINNNNVTVGTATGSYTGSNWFNMDVYEAFENKTKTVGEGASQTTKFDASQMINQVHSFSGDLVRFTYEGGAQIIDEKNQIKPLDVVITYSNLCMVFQNNFSDDDFNWFMGKSPKLSICSGNAIAMSYNGAGADLHNQRTGIYFDINIKVIDPDTNEVVNGTFYYPMVDLDQYRNYNDSGWRNLYQSEKFYGYSEQVLLKSGIASDIYIPGTTEKPYKSEIRKISDPTAPSNTVPDDVYRISAKNKQSEDNNTFYTGFNVLADNTVGGLSFSYVGFAGAYNNKLDSNLISAVNPVNHKLKATTGEGGNIATTVYGNHDGSLTDGEIIARPMIDAATGKTVVYTMYPKTGYRLKGVWVHHGSTDYTQGGEIGPGSTSGVNYVPVDSDGDGVTDYYTFTFADIDEDGAIHVEWEATTLDVKKEVENNKPDLTEDTFTFRLEIDQGQSDPQSTYLAKAWSGGSFLEKRFYRPGKSVGAVESEYEYGVPYLMYDSASNAYIGWDAANGKWISKAFAPGFWQSQEDLDSMLWVVKQVPSSLTDPGAAAGEMDTLLYNVGAGVYQDGDATPGTPVVWSAANENELRIGASTGTGTYYFQPVDASSQGFKHSFQWDGSTYHYQSWSDSYGAPPVFYEYDENTQTLQDNRNYIDLSPLGYTRVKDGDDSAFTTVVSSAAGFSKAALEQALNDANISF